MELARIVLERDGDGRVVALEAGLVEDVVHGHVAVAGVEHERPSLHLLHEEGVALQPFPEQVPPVLYLQRERVVPDAVRIPKGLLRHSSSSHLTHTNVVGLTPRSRSDLPATMCVTCESSAYATPLRASMTSFVTLSMSGF